MHMRAHKQMPPTLAEPKITKSLCHAKCTRMGSM